MAAGKYNLVIEQGSTFRQVFYWKNSDETPINLSGYTAKLQMRPSQSSTNILLELSTENGGITLTELDGKIELYLAANVTKNLTWSTAVYDLELTQSETEVHKLVRGGVSITKEITR
jgi:hypothetical protein